MGHANGSAASALTDEMASDFVLPIKVEKYNFFQLVELISQLQKADPDNSWKQDSDLFFSANPTLGFAPSDVTQLLNLGDKRIQLETTFLGLNGAQSPLPGYFLEEIIEEDEAGVRRLFLDFFNHRLLSLIHQIWRKYRYYVRFKHQASDALSNQFFALVGLSEPRLRNASEINWVKMLSYAGMLAGRARSPQMVSGIIAHCFDLEKVSIEQWVRRTVMIPQQQRMVLGQFNMHLGDETVLGERVPDCTGKFIITLHCLTAESFWQFLPTGEHFKTLASLVEFILREQLAYDLKLEMADSGESMAMSLSASTPPALGWSSFTGRVKNKRVAVINVRQ